MRRQKNFLPTLIFIILLWAAFGFIVYFVDPPIVRDILVPGAYLPFFANLFLALFLTLAFIFANTRRGLITSMGITSFLILRMSGLGNWLNLALIIGISLALDRHFARTKTPQI